MSEILLQETSVTSEGEGGACVCKENQKQGPSEHGGLIVKIVIEGESLEIWDFQNLK